MDKNSIIEEILDLFSEASIYCKEYLDDKNDGSLLVEFNNKSKLAYIKLLHCSLYEELDSIYFPELWTTCYSDPEKIQQAKDNINKIKSGERYLFLEPYDLEAIKEITNYDYISFFEAALLIGYRVENNPTMLLSNLTSMFFDAILKKEIDPRDPATHIPYTKLYESPLFYADGLIGFAKYPPDLNWELTLKETAEFAILKGYPENLFIDLLTDIEADKNDPIENQDLSNSEKEINIVLKQLASVLILLAKEKSIFKINCKPNMSQIALAVDTMLSTLEDIDTKNLSIPSLRANFTKGLAQFRK